MYRAYDCGGGYWVVLGPVMTSKVEDVGDGRGAKRKAQELATLCNRAARMALEQLGHDDEALEFTDDDDLYID